MTQGEYATHGDSGNASHLMPCDDKAIKGRLGHLWFLPILAIGRTTGYSRKGEHMEFLVQER